MGKCVWDCILSIQNKRGQDFKLDKRMILSNRAFNTLSGTSEDRATDPRCHYEKLDKERFMLSEIEMPEWLWHRRWYKSHRNRHDRVAMLGTAQKSVSWLCSARGCKGYSSHESNEKLVRRIQSLLSSSPLWVRSTGRKWLTKRVLWQQLGL